MACRKTYRNINNLTFVSAPTATDAPTITKADAEHSVERLIFGADSKHASQTLLQNNICLLEWIKRNKVFPAFMGRYLSGEQALTSEEIKFLHGYACKIAPIYTSETDKTSRELGVICANAAAEQAVKLEIPKAVAIFLEIKDNESVTKDYMKGYAKALIELGYTPGFKANTDAAFTFDREFSRGMQSDRDIFNVCMIWAVSPTVKEYDRMTTSHLIHPDNWTPFAPSAITRRDIAIWQYGKDCHPIEDVSDMMTSFNLNLVRNPSVITEKMF